MDVIRKLLLPHYDTEIVPAKDTPQEIDFFVRVLGMDFKHKPTHKTLAHTNNLGPMPFSLDKEIEIHGFAVNMDNVKLSDFAQILKSDACVCKCGFKGYPIPYKFSITKFWQWLFFRKEMCPKCSNVFIRHVSNSSFLNISIKDKLMLQVPFVQAPIDTPVAPELGKCGDGNFYTFRTLPFPMTIPIKALHTVNCRIFWPVCPPRIKEDAEIRLCFRLLELR